MPTAPRVPTFSARSSHLRQPNILRALTLRVNELADGINLGQGVCDLDMPRVLRLATVDSLFHDRATYTPFAGIPELREQICGRMARRYDLHYGEHEVLVTTGSSMAFMATLMTVIDPGDEIILFEPYYAYHQTAARLAGAEVRTVPLDREDGAVDWEALQAALGPATRIVVVNTPSNPSGKVWSRQELERLELTLRDSDALVVTDEIYEDLTYDGRVHVPPASVAGLYDRTITISGLSKSFSITGWRLGWLAAPEVIAKAIGPVFDTMAVCAARPLQAGAAGALAALEESYYTDLRDDYAVRRDRLAAALAAGGFDVRVPQGAYYMLADYSGRFGAIPPLDACFRFLEETHIGAIPADIFYADTTLPVLRFHFAVEADVLAEVSRRMAAWT